MAGIVQPRQPASSTMQKASHTHPSNGTVIPTAGTHAAASPCQHGMQANVPPSPRAFLQSTVQSLISVCQRSRKEEEHSKRHSWTAAIHAARPQHQQSRTVAAHTHRIKKKQKEKTRRQGVAVCVELRVSASPGRKGNKTRGKEMCASPHRPSSHAHTSRLPQRAVRRGPSSCVQQARRTGPSSLACRWVCEWSSWAETHGTLAGRVQQQTIKEGRVEKKKVHRDCPQKQKRGMGDERKKKNEKKNFFKQEKKQTGK
ncbi:hypothetical protein TCDM_13016 [Trypanosoma cruzi Dm28c]|uniref:Uncharacterized protein n=1 Tax=Trypanosoma cruzi Dm28c TaxID=1416333 RepID=V5APC9_TRYCR|nr:hypothetical protein TCDM_13016 [Trypanosoma cruzi Dm28c]